MRYNMEEYQLRVYASLTRLHDVTLQISVLIHPAHSKQPHNYPNVKQKSNLHISEFLDLVIIEWVSFTVYTYQGKEYTNKLSMEHKQIFRDFLKGGHFRFTSDRDTSHV